MPEAAARRAGQALVAAQFALMAALALWGGAAAWAGVPGAVLATAAVLAIAGAALGLASMRVQGLGNFRIHPAPVAGGRLVTEGPYRAVRHPMYSAVLLLGAAAAILVGSVAAWAVWAGLVLVLRLKIGLEERWLRALHPAYADYAARTRRLLPGVW